MGRLTTLALVLMMAAPAMGRDRSLLSGALNSSFKDRDQVQRSYRKNDLARTEASRQNEAREKEALRLQIEVGDDFASSSGKRISGSDDDMLLRATGLASDETANLVDTGIIDQEVKKLEVSSRHPGSASAKVDAQATP